MKKYLLLMALLSITSFSVDAQILKKLKKKIEDTKEKLESNKKSTQDSKDKSEDGYGYLDDSPINATKIHFENRFLEDLEYYTLDDNLIEYENIASSYRNAEIIELVKKSNERIITLKLLAENLDNNLDFESAAQRYSPSLLNKLRYEFKQEFFNEFFNGNVTRGFYWGSDPVNQFEQRRAYSAFLQSGIIEAIINAVTELPETTIVISGQEFPLNYDFKKKRVLIDAKLPKKRDEYFYSWELDESRAEEILQSIGGKIVYRIIDDPTPLIEGDETWLFYSDPLLNSNLVEFQTTDLKTEYKILNENGGTRTEEVEIIPRDFDQTKLGFIKEYFHDYLRKNNLLVYYDTITLNNEILEYVYYQLRSPTEILGPIVEKLGTSCSNNEDLFLTYDYGLLLSGVFNDYKNRLINQGSNLVALDSIKACDLKGGLEKGKYTEYFLKVDSRLVDSFFSYHDFTNEIYNQKEIYDYNYAKGEQLFSQSKSTKSKNEYASCYANAVTMNTMNSRHLWNALNGNQNAQIAGLCR